MTRFSRWFGLAVACLVVGPAPAAPVPETVPAPVGPITDYLRQRDALATTAAPQATRVVLRGDKLEVSVLTSHHVTEVYTRTVRVTEVVPVAEERERVVEREGKKVTEKYVVTRNVTREVEVPQQYAVTVARSVMHTVRVPAKEVRYYTVTREGKLEGVEAAKAGRQLAEPAAVLMGTGVTVDPRHLEPRRPAFAYNPSPNEDLG
jgi:hypothetical protein